MADLFTMDTRCEWEGGGEGEDRQGRWREVGGTGRREVKKEAGGEAEHVRRGERNPERNGRYEEDGGGEQPEGGWSGDREREGFELREAGESRREMASRGYEHSPDFAVSCNELHRGRRNGPDERDLAGGEVGNVRQVERGRQWGRLA